MRIKIDKIKKDLTLEDGKKGETHILSWRKANHELCLKWMKIKKGWNENDIIEWDVWKEMTRWYLRGVKTFRSSIITYTLYTVKSTTRINVTSKRGNSILELKNLF